MFVVELKFVSPMHNEAKQTKMLQFGAEQFIAGPTKEKE